MRVMQWAMVAVLGASILDLQGAEIEKPNGKRTWLQPSKDAKVVAVNTLALMDRNKDGTVTEVEFFEYVKDRAFRRLDANQDNMVSKSEWLAIETGPEAGAQFARWDKNGDGSLTLAEFKDTPEARVTLGNLFKTLDVNRDGKLSAKELENEEG